MINPFTEEEGIVPLAGYYLLDMTPRLARKDWQDQERSIAALGEDFHRADESVFSQAILVHQRLAGQEPFLDVFHWGRAESCGYHVCVRLADSGLIGDYISSSYSDRHFLCVCVARKSGLHALIA